MIKKWLTYLFVCSLALTWSCGAAEESRYEDKAVGEEYVEYEEGQNAAYAEAVEEATTDDMVEEESHEHVKGVAEEESYSVITTDQLSALQVRAVQKVNELIEYIQIMSNEEYDIEMRKNAKKMAVNLFDDKAMIYAPSITGKKDSVAVKSILKDVLKREIVLDSISVEDIDIADDETVYCNFIADNIGIRLFFKVNMEFETKQFGDESIDVWTVYLGGVEEY